MDGLADDGEAEEYRKNLSSVKIQWKDQSNFNEFATVPIDDVIFALHQTGTCFTVARIKTMINVIKDALPETLHSSIVDTRGRALKVDGLLSHLVTYLDKQWLHSNAEINTPLRRSKQQYIAKTQAFLATLTADEKRVWKAKQKLRKGKKGEPVNKRKNDDDTVPEDMTPPKKLRLE